MPDKFEFRRVLTRKGRFDYLLVGSTGVSEPVPAAEPGLAAVDETE